MAKEFPTELLNKYYARGMEMKRQMYNLIELHSGVKGICRYDRVGALLRVHQLNKMNPKDRWAICAV